MKVKFLQDFQGRETKEVFYKKDQEVDLPDHVAELLLADRRVELVARVETPEDFVTPVVFENVTGVETEVVDVHKAGGEVNVVEGEEEVLTFQPLDGSPPPTAEEFSKTHPKPRARKGHK